jgi:hypothetical protein
METEWDGREPYALKARAKDALYVVLSWVVVISALVGIAKIPADVREWLVIGVGIALTPCIGPLLVGAMIQWGWWKGLAVTLSVWTVLALVLVAALLIIGTDSAYQCHPGWEHWSRYVNSGC